MENEGERRNTRGPEEESALVTAGSGVLAQPKLRDEFE